MAVLLGTITTSAAREWLEAMSPIHSCGQPNPREAVVCSKCQEPLTPPEPEPEYVPQHQGPPERWSPWSPLPAEVPLTRTHEAILSAVQQHQGGHRSDWAFGRRR